MEDLHIKINKLIQLNDTKYVKMLMDEEQFQFVTKTGISDTKYKDLQYFLRNIIGAEISQVNLHPYFK